MQGEHYCSKHDVVFFKKGNMKGYAHPIKDEDGETVGWCNEETPPKPEQSDPKPEPQTQKELGGAVKRDCKSFCLSYSKDMVVSQDVEPKDVIFYAYQMYQWMVDEIDAQQATKNLYSAEGKKDYRPK